MTEERRVNRLIAILFGSVSLLLIGAYIIEFVKGARSITYLIVFIILLLIPSIINAIL